MQACMSIKDSLRGMSARLEEIAVQFEPAVEAPAELRLIAQLIDQFRRRPLEPLSFQLMHIDHLVDMIDNADNPVEMWSGVTQTLSDYYVSQYYNNMQDEIIDNYLEIEPVLIDVAKQCHDFIISSDNPAKLEQHRENMMKQVQAISSMLNRIHENMAQ